METSAYYEGYLDNAQDILGNMLDYAVNRCCLDPEDFFVMFLTSGAAEQFERGNPRYVVGMTGAELAKEVIQKVTGKEPEEPEEPDLDKTPEYWCGWILAYYQWRTCRSFQRIYQVIPIKELLHLYPTHHEADVERAVDTMNHIYKKRHTKTYLQQKRENMGLSIAELARQCGVSQEMYEKLENDFTKIQSTEAQTVFRLSRILGCRMEDVLEI